MKPVAALFGAGAALRAQTSDVRGGAVIEVALTITVLVIFLFGIIEFGFAMWLQNALDYSVAEAARCATINATVCGNSDQIKSYAASQSGFGFDPSVFTVTNPATVPSPPQCSNGNQVSARYPMTITIPTLTFSITLVAQACYPS
jgi:Flp pilus assembly protein TadG